MKKRTISLLIVILISSCSVLSNENTDSELNSSSSFQTATITHRPTDTITPTKTLMPSPTQDESWQSVFSPDGKLVAKMYEGYWHSFIAQVIEIQDLEGDVIWAVPFQGELQRSDPHSTMRIIDWAPDGSALYFYYSWAYDGGYTLFDGHDLQMLDIETGKLRGLLTDGIISFAFTPDMSKFAYTVRGRIGIYDIATGDDRNVAIRSDGIEQSGNIHWSPSSDGLVFTVLLDDVFF
jgi:WD40 repeat protein